MRSGEKLLSIKGDELDGFLGFSRSFVFNPNLLASFQSIKVSSAPDSEYCESCGVAMVSYFCGRESPCGSSSSGDLTHPFRFLHRRRQVAPAPSSSSTSLPAGVPAIPPQTPAPAPPAWVVHICLRGKRVPVGR